MIDKRLVRRNHGNCFMRGCTVNAGRDHYARDHLICTDGFTGTSERQHEERQRRGEGGHGCANSCAGK